MKTAKSYFVPIAVLVASCLAFLLLSYLSYDKIGKLANAMPAGDLPVIVLDPGHGGEDGGATGFSKTVEKELNLDIALQLQSLLTDAGYQVVMTRDTDRAINDEGLDTVRERKVSDIHNRVKLVESQQNCILVSIHQNHFESARYSGAQIFYSPNNAQSKLLAEAIRGRVTGLTQPENKRESKAATSSIYLLWHTKAPAVLVECGFLSNESEAKKLTDPEYRKQMAFSVYCGIADYLYNPEETPIMDEGISSDTNSD